MISPYGTAKYDRLALDGLTRNQPNGEKGFSDLK